MSGRIVDIGALRMRVLKEGWEQRLDKQPDGSWRGPATRVILEAELSSVDPTKGQRVLASGWTTSDCIFGHGNFVRAMDAWMTMLSLPPSMLRRVDFDASEERGVRYVTMVPVEEVDDTW